MNYKHGRSVEANRKQYLRDYNRAWRKRNPNYYKEWYKKNFPKIIK